MGLQSTVRSLVQSFLTRPRVSLVTEAFNLAEGQSKDAFVRALETVERIAQSHQDVEVIVVDPTPDNVAKDIVGQNYPHVRVLHVAGKTYDGQKNAAAREASGEYLVFLDGDCVPQRDSWLADLLAPFANSRIHAVGGLTIYEGRDITSIAMSVLDFGFLFEPDQNNRIGCYASNNVAFRRRSYLAMPAPDEGVLRSYCFKHAQLFMRAGKGVYLQPAAYVLHELPDVVKERTRRGYDYLAALWADPALLETPHIAATDAFVDRLIEANHALALRRLSVAPVELGVTTESRPLVEAEISRLMDIDRQGLREACEYGENTGMNDKARRAHQALR